VAVLIVVNVERLVTCRDAPVMTDDAGKVNRFTKLTLAIIGNGSVF
jgi:hypothetical protein